MEPINLLVEVHCYIPDWVFLPYNQQQTRTNIYRLYLDNDLLTERTWAWDYTRIYIEEDVWIRVERNKSYNLILEPVLDNPAQAKFRFSNFHIKGQYNSSAVNDKQINFVLK